MRHYEVMIILDPSLDERTVAPSLENYLNVIRTSGGTVEKVDVWGKRRLAYEINKQTEGILKDMITGDTLMIEPKFMSATELQSFTRVMITSNEKWVIPAGVAERRFFVLNCIEKFADPIEIAGAVNRSA